MKPLSTLRWLAIVLASGHFVESAIASTFESSKASIENRPKEGRVVEVSEQNFDVQVLKSPVPVLVDFYAHWCGPCKLQSPVLDQTARELVDARIVKVNIDQNGRLAAAYGVRSIPTLLVFENGKPVVRHVGLANKERIKSLLKRGAAE